VLQQHCSKTSLKQHEQKERRKQAASLVKPQLEQDPGGEVGGRGGGGGSGAETVDARGGDLFR